MPRRWPRRIALIILAAIALTSWLRLYRSTSDTFYPVPEIAREQADYYMREFNILETDSWGKKSLSVDGARLLHYPNQRRSQITRPAVSVIDNDARWNLYATTGWLTDDTRELTLAGSVLVERGETAQLQAIEIETSDLEVDINNSRLRTDQPVSIKSDRWEMSAVGVETALDGGQLNFLSQVRGHYDPPLQ